MTPLPAPLVGRLVSKCNEELTELAKSERLILLLRDHPDEFTMTEKMAIGLTCTATHRRLKSFISAIKHLVRAV